MKIPATSCGESSIVKENAFFIRSLTPPQAAGNALAVQFKDKDLTPRNPDLLYSTILMFLGTTERTYSFFPGKPCTQVVFLPNNIQQVWRL